MSKVTTKLFLAAGLVAAAFVPVASAQSPASDGIPNLASANFGWQTNVADWYDPPASMGHGPIHPDPAHPFMSNAEAARRGVQPTLRIGDTKDPVLKPWAAKFMADSNEEALRGDRQVPFAAQARCWPGGVPGQLLYPFEPFYFIQTPTDVWMMWQRDHMVRHVRMNANHLENPTPSWFGDSVGHYENGDTLVVDTIGMNAKTFVDSFRTPHTEKLHVVERFKLLEGGKQMQIRMTVDDPDTFNQPWEAVRTYRRMQGTLQEEACAENNFFFDYGIPKADKPDF
jgi:hypothetical protein